MYYVSCVIQEAETSKPWLSAATDSVDTLEEALKLVKSYRENYRVISAMVDEIKSDGTIQAAYHECFLDASGQLHDPKKEDLQESTSYNEGKNYQMISGSTRQFPYDRIQILLPDQKHLVEIAEGTGDNLLYEDQEDGYVDYIYYTIYETRGESLEELRDLFSEVEPVEEYEEYEGGMVLLKELFRNKYTKTEDCIPDVLDMILL